MRGYIDRVDRAPDGGLRVIDYKTGGPSSFTKRDLEKGKKLQLPLYALAARDALHLGTPVDGFYWHVKHAEPSEFTLARAARPPWRVPPSMPGRLSTAYATAVSPPIRRTVVVLTTVPRLPSAGAIARRITSEVSMT